MKLQILFLLILFGATSTFAKDYYLQCGDQHPTIWKNYYCLSGDINYETNVITNVEFGVCEGSQKDEESEPVDEVEIELVKTNKALASKSKAWRKSTPFDFSTKEFGTAVLYIIKSKIRKSYDFKARLKLNKGIRGLKKDVKLNCSSS